MRKTKSPPKKKFRLLLDAAFAKPNAFPRLNKKANLAHVVFDCRLPVQAEDEQIYQTAVAENRFILTINVKDFKKLVKPGKSGVIGIESQLTNQEIDRMVSMFLSGKDPEHYIGKTITIKQNASLSKSLSRS